MPDPYKGNDKAALFVDYYASRHMLKNAVYRLHTKAIREREEAVAEVEQEVYPPTPRVVRSEEEVKKYLEKRVNKELLRRQQRKAELERNYYPELYTHQQITDSKLQEQLQRLYTPRTPERKVERRPIRHRDPVTGKWIDPPEEKKEEEKKDGAAGEEEGAAAGEKKEGEGGEEGKKPKRSESRKRRGRKAAGPAQWRPSFGGLDESHSVLERLYAPPRRKPAPIDPKKREERIRTLSRPLHVTPKPTPPHRSSSTKPAFKVPRQMKYDDEFLFKED